MTIFTNTISSASAQSAEDIRENIQDLRSRLNGGLDSGSVATGEKIVIIPMFSLFLLDDPDTSANAFTFVPLRDGKISYLYAYQIQFFGSVAIAVNGTEKFRISVQSSYDQEVSTDNVNVEYSAGDIVTVSLVDTGEFGDVSIYFERSEDGL